MIPTRKLLTLALTLSFAAVNANSKAQSTPEAAVSALMSAWNAKDAHAFASQFASDATFVNVNGAIWIGSKEIEQRLAGNTAFKTSHAELKPETQRLLTPDVALLHVSWTITADPRSPEPRSYLMTMVLTKHHDRWLIAATQNGSAFDHSVFSGAKVPPGTPLPIIHESGQVKKLFTKFDSKWNRPDLIPLSNQPDLTPLSNLFAEDADLVDTSAHHLRGRPAIAEQIADQLAHSLKSTTSHTTVLTINSLNPHLAVLEVRWELTGGDMPITITGLRLISEKNENWQIVAAQDTIARP
jgi:uncharacterized protein (TIGR02246 family)